MRMKLWNFSLRYRSCLQRGLHRQGEVHVARSLELLASDIDGVHDYLVVKRHVSSHRGASIVIFLARSQVAM